MGSPTVFIVDDDSGVRKSLSVLLATANLKVEGFASAEEFLGSFDPDREGVLVLDVRMGISSPELQHVLSQRGNLLANHFFTAHGELTLGVTSRRRMCGCVVSSRRPTSFHGGVTHLPKAKIALVSTSVPLQERRRFT